MAQGTVKWFSHEKGYGFISPDDGGEDLFVHYSGISGSGFRTLEESAKVSYEAAQGNKGMQAINVTPVTQAKNVTQTSEKCYNCGGSSRCPDCDGTGNAVTGYYRLGCRSCYGWDDDDKEGSGVCYACRGTGLDKRYPIPLH